MQQQTDVFSRYTFVCVWLVGECQLSALKPGACPADDLGRGVGVMICSVCRFGRLFHEYSESGKVSFPASGVNLSLHASECSSVAPPNELALGKTVFTIFVAFEVDNFIGGAVRPLGLLRRSRDSKARTTENVDLGPKPAKLFPRYMGVWPIHAHITSRETMRNSLYILRRHECIYVLLEPDPESRCKAAATDESPWQPNRASGTASR